MLVLSMVEAFQRRDIEGSKNPHRMEMLEDAYLVEKQVVVRDCVMMLILCVLWEFRRAMASAWPTRISERSPRGHRNMVSDWLMRNWFCTP